MAISTELVSDILLRLPAKTVARFRCVSKEWSSLCFEPYLAKLRRQDHLNWKLIAKDGLLYSLDLGSLHCAFRDEHLLKDSNFTVKKVLGCSNGKLCLSVSDNNANPVAGDYDYPVWVYDIPPVELNDDLIVICDLSTGARRIVPPSPVDFQVKSLADVHRRNQDLWGEQDLIGRLYLQRRFSYGFGFDPSGEDYKLVRISQYIFIDSDPEYLLTEAKVYSMKTDSWSRVDQDMPEIHLNDEMESVLVEGVLYWAAGGSSFAPAKLDQWVSYCDTVVAFDLAEESFRGVAHEEELDLLCLGTSIGGKLCALSCDSRRVKLWKVEDHGDVWTPLASFARKNWFPRSFFIYNQAMTFSMNGDKVLVDDICCDLPEETAGMCQVKLI